MPGYRTHDIAAYTAAPIIIVTSLYVIPPIYSLLLGAAFLVSNYYFSPDLDIDSIMNRRWGALQWLWWPYKRLFRHRSFWTHSGPFSATVRFLYIVLWLLPLFLIIPPPHYTFVVICYLAMILADMLHTALDLLF